MQIALHDGRTVETTTATKAELLEAANALGMTTAFLSQFGDCRFREPWQKAVEALATERANHPELQPSPNPYESAAATVEQSAALYNAFRERTRQLLLTYFDATRAADFATAIARRNFGLSLSVRDRELLARYDEWYARRQLAGREPQRELATA